MLEMTSKEVTEYLKYASMLEASVYRQEEAIHAAKQQLVLVKPVLPDISEPVNEAERLLKPEKLKSQGGHKVLFTWGGIQGVLGLCSIIILGISFLGIANLLIGIFILWLGVIIRKSGRAKYENDLKEYETKHADLLEQYKRDMEVYQEKKKYAKEEYSRDLANAQQRLQEAADAVAILEEPLQETKEALEKLYSKDVVFPKYRDMVAMCTMYEYFVSGRCTELTGPDGAYNLYEAELRQNLIINRLDIIVSQLEKLKQNQYMLYQEMCETNRIIKNISDDVKSIVRNTA